MEVDAPVAGVSLDIWLSYLFQEQELGNSRTSLRFPPDPSGTVRSFDVSGNAGGKNNVLVLLFVSQFSGEGRMVDSSNPPRTSATPSSCSPTWETSAARTFPTALSHRAPGR